MAHKYHAKATTVDNIRFSSKAEANRYLELRLLERAGQIKELELQPKFPLYVCARKNGELTKVAFYIADFSYRSGPTGVLVIEDVKGAPPTTVYRLKARMFTAQYGMSITEIGSPSKKRRSTRKAGAKTADSVVQLEPRAGRLNPAHFINEVGLDD